MLNLRSIYRTSSGALFNCSVESFIRSRQFARLKGRVNLILTSPPFPLTREKRYGNFKGAEYVKWLSSLAEPLGDMLTSDGSLAIELGNAWEPGRPIQSLTPLKALLRFVAEGGFKLVQEFVVYNPARLPSPVQWVNVERIRVKDSFTRVWWLSRTDRPKASNRNVLAPYSSSMRRLLKAKQYNSGKRPSGHAISKAAFAAENGGSIPPNVILDPADVWAHGDLLIEGNTRESPEYLTYCRDNELPVHPARMQPNAVEFFIRLATTEGDLVVDPFAGSNTTGRVAENLGRKWIGVERDLLYAQGSLGRFPSLLKSLP